MPCSSLGKTRHCDKYYEVVGPDLNEFRKKLRMAVTNYLNMQDGGKSERFFHAWSEGESKWAGLVAG